MSVIAGYMAVTGYRAFGRSDGWVNGAKGA